MIEDVQTFRANNVDRPNDETGFAADDDWPMKQEKEKKVVCPIRLVGRGTLN